MNTLSKILTQVLCIVIGIVIAITYNKQTAQQFSQKPSDVFEKLRPSEVLDELKIKYRNSRYMPGWVVHEKAIPAVSTVILNASTLPTLDDKKLQTMVQNKYIEHIEKHGGKCDYVSSTGTTKNEYVQANTRIKYSSRGRIGIVNITKLDLTWVFSIYEVPKRT